MSRIGNLERMVGASTIVTNGPIWNSGQRNLVEFADYPVGDRSVGCARNGEFFMGHIWPLGRLLLAGCGLSILPSGCATVTHRPDASWEGVPPENAAHPPPHGAYASDHLAPPPGLHKTPVPVEKNMMSLPDYR